ncbi:MAG: glycerophosphodiester phosphodiesterase [Bryobacterales bacterium]|nr:glycerophosphodiester phosphodiesterase [Bryobacterales bacterium]
MSRCLLLKAIFIMTVISAQSYPRILVHGHRGARAVRPENTLPAFEYAIGVGADVLELDLAVTKDNVLVVSHDPVLPEKTCQGPAGATRVIREMTLEQLREWDCGSRPNTVFPKQQPVPLAGVPTFDEVLAVAPRGKFEFNVETKIFARQPELTPDPETFARLVIDAVRRHKLESRVMIQSFDFRTLEAAARIAPEIRRSALYSGPPRDLVALTRVARASICSPEHRLVTPMNVRALHDAGLQVVPWTANDPESWQRLIDARVDAIITDDPAALIEFLKTKGLR